MEITEAVVPEVQEPVRMGIPPSIRQMAQLPLREEDLGETAEQAVMVMGHLRLQVREEEAVVAEQAGLREPEEQDTTARLSSAGPFLPVIAQAMPFRFSTK
jgi:hypothetical protein